MSETKFSSTSIIPSPTEASKKRSEADYRLSVGVVRGYAGHLKFCMEAGLLARVRICVEFLRRSQCVSEEWLVQLISQADKWLASAEKLERQQGSV